MIGALMVLLWLGVVAGIVLTVAWRTRADPVPTVRDSELPSTEPSADTDLQHTVPMRVWRDPPRWHNTVPTGPAPLADPIAPRQEPAP